MILSPRLLKWLKQEFHGLAEEGLISHYQYQSILTRYTDKWIAQRKKARKLAFYMVLSIAGTLLILFIFLL